MKNGESVTEVVEELPGREWITDRLTRADRQARLLLTEHPILALAGAVGLGYLLARLLRSTK